MHAPAAAAVPLRADASTIGVVSLAHGVSHFGQLIVPPLFPWIGAAFGLSYTQLGLLLTVFFVVSFAGQAVAGFVVDRLGAERVLYAGLGAMTLAPLGLALSPNYPTMFVFMALAGLGNCVFHPVDFSILNARVSTPRLGHAYAAHGISGNLGWAAAPAVVVGLTTATGSWRTALMGVSLLFAGVLLVVWLQRAHLAIDRPATAAAAAPAGAAARPAASGFGFLKLPAVWACFGFFTVYAMALGGVQSFAPQAAGQLHGLAAGQVAMCLSIYMVAAGAGMVLGGHLVRDPRRSVHVAAGGFAMAALLAFAIGLGSWSPLAVLVLFALMGFGAGIAGPSRDLLVKQATPPGATGRVYGVVYSGLDVGMMVAPLGFGLLMDHQRYQGVWIADGLLLAMLILTAVNVRRQARPTAVPKAA